MVLLFMGIFSKRDKIIDLTEDYHYERKHPRSTLKGDSSESSSSADESSVGGFFNWMGSRGSDTSEGFNSPSEDNLGNFDSETGKPLDAGEKRRRLAKRLKDMTDRIEDLSNQVYILQQRIEVLEKKTNTGNYDL